MRQNSSIYVCIKSMTNSRRRGQLQFYCFSSFFSEIFCANSATLSNKIYKQKSKNLSAYCVIAHTSCPSNHSYFFLIFVIIVLKQVLEQLCSPINVTMCDAALTKPREYHDDLSEDDLSQIGHDKHLIQRIMIDTVVWNSHQLQLH